MAQFWLKIIASNHVFYSGKCEKLIVPGQDGETGILAHHEPMILAIREGTLKYQVSGSESWQEAAVGCGVLQVVHNRATMLVDFAERPDDIDEKRAREALERAEEQLRQKQSQIEYQMSKASMARALTRLKLTQHEIN